MLRFLFEDDGQDIVEYALLGALIGISGILVWQQVAQAVGVAYTAADGDIQNLCPMPNPDGTAAPQPCGP